MKSYIYTIIILFIGLFLVNCGDGDSNSSKNNFDKNDRIISETNNDFKHNHKDIFIEIKDILANFIEEQEQKQKIIKEIDSIIELNKSLISYSNILNEEFVKDNIDFDRIKEYQINSIKATIVYVENVFNHIVIISNYLNKDERVKTIDILGDLFKNKKEVKKQIFENKKMKMIGILSNLGFSEEQISNIEPLYRSIRKQMKTKFDYLEKEDFIKENIDDFINNTLNKEKVLNYFTKKLDTFNNDFEVFKTNLNHIHSIFTPEQRKAFMNKFEKKRSKQINK